MGKEKLNCPSRPVVSGHVSLTAVPGSHFSTVEGSGLGQRVLVRSCCSHLSSRGQLPTSVALSL